MEMLRLQDRRFKRAVILSVTVHLLLFIMLIISPYLPKPSRRDMVHYVELASFGGGGRPGGGGGGGGRISAPPTKTEQDVETEVLEPQSLRDLTTPAKLEERRPPSMTYPVDKPKRDNSPKPEKKAVIQKAQPGPKRPGGTPTEGGSQSGTRSGSGLGIGIGDGEGGYGFGEGYGSGALSTFPYNYYLAEVRNRIASNWMTAQIRSGTSGNDFAEVRFRIFRDGRVSDPEILNSSDNATMKMSALRAIRNASPFPPLPRGYTDDVLIIRLMFEHNK